MFALTTNSTIFHFFNTFFKHLLYGTGHLVEDHSNNMKEGKVCFNYELNQICFMAQDIWLKII